VINIESTVETAAPSLRKGLGYINLHDLNIGLGEVQTDLETCGDVTVRLVL